MPVSRCGLPVYFAAGQQVTPEQEGAPLICTRCMVMDPALRAGTNPEYVRLARQMHQVVDNPVLRAELVRLMGIYSN
jgi:hypothetical protein